MGSSGADRALKIVAVGWVLARRRDAMRRSRSVSLIFVAWVVIGVIVAVGHHYFSHLTTLGSYLSALVAILLWPLILLGTKITINL